MTTITATGIFVGCAVMILGTLGGWRLRPKPPARISAAPRARRWLFIAGAGIAAALLPSLRAVVAGICAVTARRTGRVHVEEPRTTRRIAQRLSRRARSVGAVDPRRVSAGAGNRRDHTVPPAPASPVVHSGRRGDARAAIASLTRSRVLRAELGPIAQPLVDSLSAADRYGLPLAPVLERLSFEARQQRRRDADATARELPVRLAIPLVLCTLPSFVLLAIVPLLLGALSSLHM